MVSYSKIKQLKNKISATCAGMMTHSPDMTSNVVEKATEEIWNDIILLMNDYKYHNVFELLDMWKGELNYNCVKELCEEDKEKLKEGYYEFLETIHENNIEIDDEVKEIIQYEQSSRDMLIKIYFIMKEFLPTDTKYHINYFEYSDGGHDYHISIDATCPNIHYQEAWNIRDKISDKVIASDLRPSLTPSSIHFDIHGEKGFEKKKDSDDLWYDDFEEVL